METRPTPAHVYHSTGCYHGNHGHCRNDRALSGAPKKPHTCKFCAAECICPCHRGIDVSSLSAEDLHALTFTAMIRTHVGTGNGVDFGAIKNIMVTLGEVLLEAGNPWADQPAPEEIIGAVDHGLDVLNYLRDLQ